MSRCILSVAMMCGLVVLVGCGQSGISIQGTISLNGQPLESAEIQFFPIDSATGEHIGTVVSNGAFEVEPSQRIKEGEYQVQIRAFRSTGKKIWDGMGDGENKTMVDDFQQYSPSIYNDASKLTVVLQQGKNEFSSDLTIPAR